MVAKSFKISLILLSQVYCHHAFLCPLSSPVSSDADFFKGSYCYVFMHPLRVHYLCLYPEMIHYVVVLSKHCSILCACFHIN